MSERIWLVTFMDYDLGYFDDQTCRLEPLENPFETRATCPLAIRAANEQRQSYLRAGGPPGASDAYLAGLPLAKGWRLDAAACLEASFLSRMALTKTSWVGLQCIVDWMLDVPASLAVFFLSFLLIVIFVLIESAFYQANGGALLEGF